MDDLFDDIEDALNPNSFGAEEVLIFFGVLIGLMLLAFFIAAAVKGTQNAQNAACPMESKWAKVVDKQNLPGNAILSMSQMWVVFEFADGSRRRLNIPATQTVVIGDTGTLTWQGEAMISFRQGMGVPQSHPQASGSFNVEHLPAWKRVEIMEAQKKEAEKTAKATPEKAETAAEAAETAEAVEAAEAAEAVEAAEAPKAKVNKYCVYCGEPMNEDHLFCGACGKRRE